MIRKIALSTAAASLAIAPVAAQAADRASAPVASAEGMAGGAGVPVILSILAAVGIILAVTSSNEDDEEPFSP